MDNKKEFSFTTQDLLKDLPPERPLEEIREKYRSQIAACVAEYSQAVGTRTWRKISEVTISLAKGLASQMGRLVEWTDDLIPEFDLSSAQLCPAFATRGVAAAEPPATDSPRSYSFEKLGADCSARIVLEVVGSNLDMVVSFLDRLGTTALPFCLTIKDQETQKILLDKKEFCAGPARIKGVECGEYAIRCEQGNRVCEFMITVRG